MTVEVVAHGEVLVDFSQHGRGPLGFPAYEALPGGGVANLAVALAQWGHRVAFSGRVGQDALGDLLRHTLADRGVDVVRLVSSSRSTSMAIVSLDAHGERSFDFLWKGTSCEGIPAVACHGSPQLFHFSSVSMSDPEGRRNNLESAARHRQAGVVVSFDPNLRLNLWPSADQARRAIEEALALADIVKLSEEEVAFVLDEPLRDPENQTRRLAEQYRFSALFVTRGAQGCLWFCHGQSGAEQPPQVSVVDTTGAGDCFMAGVLHVYLGLGKTLNGLTPQDARTMAVFGVAAGSASTTQRGGVPSIPSLEMIGTYLKGR